VYVCVVQLVTVAAGVAALVAGLVAAGCGWLPAAAAAPRAPASDVARHGVRTAA
jgi:hypothetical protein